MHMYHGMRWMTWHLPTQQQKFKDMILISKATRPYKGDGPFMEWLDKLKAKIAMSSLVHPNANHYVKLICGLLEGQAGELVGRDLKSTDQIPAVAMRTFSVI